MDETLVHARALTKSNKVAQAHQSDFVIGTVKTTETEGKMGKIYIRPGVVDMFSELKGAGFEIILFTAGNLYYMKSIIKMIFPSQFTAGEPFNHLLCRDQMRAVIDQTTQQGNLVKDL